jgi:hypothetical protein
MVTITDFEVGKFKLAFNEQTVNDLQSCIDRNMPTIMAELFGVELLALYEAGILVNDPLYTLLRDEFIIQDNCLLISKGIKDMLMGFIWCEFQREIYSTPTTTGNVKAKSQNSVDISFPTMMYQINWLASLKSYESIQALCQERYDDYPTFKGVKKYPILAL